MENVLVYLQVKINLVLNKSRTWIFPNIGNISFFILDYLQEKTSDKIFKKSKKKIFCDQFGSFLLKFGQKCISVGKRAVPVFEYSNYLLSRQKSEKN